MPKPDLDNAYSLDTPEATRALYRDWAESYDQSFAEARGYRSPVEVARVFRERFDGSGPVLDIGAGTGLLGAQLAGFEVDGVDLSPEMLEQACAKGVYRDLITADLTKTLPMPSESYGGLVSTGTFTHGHVGAECLGELLRVARPGALFACSVVGPVYDSAGFGSALALLVAKSAITPVKFHDFALYDKEGDAHSDDRALIMEFRKL